MGIRVFNNLLGEYGMNVEKIKEKVKEYLDEKRYAHVERVVISAEELAKIYLPNKIEKVIISAWLHDVAKFFDMELMLELIGEKYPEVNGKDSRSKAILHGFAGAEFVRKNFHIFEVDDEEILDGIKYHTIGSGNMTILSKIVYLADAIESGRKWEGVEKARELSKISLDAGIKYEIDEKLKHLMEKDTIIHPNIILFRNSLL